MARNEYVTTSWFEGSSNPNDIKTEDFERFLLHNRLRGHVYQVVGHDGDYLVIKYGTEEFSISKDACIKLAVQNVLQVGEKVALTESSAVACIREIVWHFKRQEPFYLVTVDDRKKSRRYAHHELVAVR
ncbi:hypothetical protein [Rhodobacter sp. 24-YEA-8]|uniref:hypothetical protein n=1 Tax=Rhodobacter sp. 24-YEA-8 TaxID=1884310 RepID=UPI00089ADD79|nr:hypothetical protein [Rhodobacter sp. 24-YEA-8]SEB67351.1 hypothetical protein SAMN05519105_1058 [Rhodobacter sp. 24-YEA-8]